MKRFVALLTGTAIVLAAVMLARSFGSGRAPNILVLSFCSLKKSHIGLFGYSTRPTTPNIDRWFAQTGSLVFRNLFNSQGWTSLVTATTEKIADDFWKRSAYRTFGRHMFRVPKEKFFEIDPSIEISLNDFNKDFRADYEKFKEMVLKAKDQPFFTIAHFKYLHYPLIDRFAQGAKWDHFLDESEKRRVEEYVRHPERFPDKLPLLIMLTNDTRSVLAHPDFRSFRDLGNEALQQQLLGLITNETYLAKWQKSPGFEKDLELIGKIYDADLRFLDELLADALNLWGNEELKKNTIVVFTGDHGEMFMEHGHFTHGTTLFDEAMEVPFAMRFPQSEALAAQVEKQVHFGIVAEQLRWIMQYPGAATPERLKARIEEEKDDMVVMRNCSNSQHGLRVGNQWKYFSDSATGEDFLFNLKEDPRETRNVALERPELVNEFEAKYWANLGRFTFQRVNNCAPWPQPRN